MAMLLQMVTEMRSEQATMRAEQVSMRAQLQALTNSNTTARRSPGEQQRRSPQSSLGERSISGGAQPPGGFPSAPTSSHDLMADALGPSHK